MVKFLAANIEALQKQASADFDTFRSQLSASIEIYQSSFIYRWRSRAAERNPAKPKHQHLTNVERLEAIINGSLSAQALKSDVESYLNSAKNFSGFGKLSALRTGLSKAIRKFLAFPHNLADIDSRLSLMIDEGDEPHQANEVLMGEIENIDIPRLKALLADSQAEVVRLKEERDQRQAPAMNRQPVVEPVMASRENNAAIEQRVVELEQTLAQKEQQLHEVRAALVQQQTQVARQRQALQSVNAAFIKQTENAELLQKQSDIKGVVINQQEESINELRKSVSNYKGAALDYKYHADTLIHSLTRILASVVAIFKSSVIGTQATGILAARKDHSARKKIRADIVKQFKDKKGPSYDLIENRVDPDNHKLSADSVFRDYSAQVQSLNSLFEHKADDVGEDVIDYRSVLAEMPAVKLLALPAGGEVSYDLDVTPPPSPERVSQAVVQQQVTAPVAPTAEMSAPPSAPPPPPPMSVTKVGNQSLFKRSASPKAPVAAKPQKSALNFMDELQAKLQKPTLTPAKSRALTPKPVTEAEDLASIFAAGAKNIRKFVVNSSPECSDSEDGFNDAPASKVFGKKH